MFCDSVGSVGSVVCGVSSFEFRAELFFKIREIIVGSWMHYYRSIVTSTVARTPARQSITILVQL